MGGSEVARHGLAVGGGVTLLALVCVGAASSGASGSGSPTTERREGSGCCVARYAAPKAGAARATLKYWTPKRMRRARPRELLRLKPTAVSRAAHPIPTGQPGRREPIPPSMNARSSSGAQPAASAPQGFGMRLVPWGGYDNLPTQVHGKIFARDRLGPYECSATVVASRRRSVVYTAGHCVFHWLTGWARRLIFVPAFDRGRAPYGRWTWHVMWIPNRWVRGNPNFDVAAIGMRRKFGRRLHDVVGAAGFAWNIRPRRSYRVFGYPHNWYRGRRMVACRRWLGHRLRVPTFGPRPGGVRCNVGGGGSGGGWLIEDEYVASVSSFRVWPAWRRLIFGPYFTGVAARILRKAEWSR